MKRLSLALCALALCAGVTGPARAETLSPVKTAELSARLFAAGVEMGDPLLVISAARLRKAINPTPGGLAPEGATPAASDEAPLGWQDMLTRAEEMAGENDVLLALIEDVRATTTKGVASGPVYNISSLGNGKSDTYPAEEFVGGEYAEVYVEAKSATDLNLTVTDAQGRLVCSDTDKSHIAYCGWTPSENGRFTMKVQNKGPNGASYALMTN